MPTKLPNRKKKPGVLGTTTNGSAGNFTDSAMDEFLAKRGLYRKPIAKDGSCLFRAVSEQVHNCQARHLDVRNQCIAFMRQNREQFEAFVEGPFDHHLFKLQNPKEWAGQVEITALSQMYRKDFVVYQDINSSPTKVTDHGYKDKILLCYSNGNHYDIIYHIEFQEHSAMCQSILYEILYNKVFIELDKKGNARKGKQKGTNNLDNSRNSQKSIMDLVNGCMTDDTDTVENGGDDDGWTEVKSKARAKHERLAKPVEVDENKEPEENKGKTNNDQKSLWELRRSLDPHLYRNISLEVWEEDKTFRQQQDLAVAASMQYKTNDRCLVKLGPPNAPVDKNYNAVIKEDYSGGGTVLVYVHELKEKQVVPVQYVKPFENQQGHNYKDLTGYYKKEEGTNSPVPEDGSKDDNKNKKKRPPRRRGPGKGGDDSGNVSEDAPRSRGRQRYGNRRRFPNSKDDRIARDEEEARFIAEQIKLVELQEKDPKAFPALPVRAAPQVSPTVPAISPQQSADVEEKVKVPHPTPPAEEKPPEKDKVPTSIDSSPAEFWSRLKTKPANEVPNHSNSPLTSPTAKQKENQPQQNLEEILNKPPITKEEKKQEKQEPVEEEEVIEAASENQPFVDDIESTKPKQTAVPELEKRQYQTALQLKPLTTDVKHSKATVQVYEVKIPQPAKLMQQAKVSPPSKLIQQQQQEAKSPLQPQHLETRDANLPSSLVESHDETIEKDFPKPAMENKMVEDDEVAGSNIKESEGNETIPLCDHGELSTEMPSSTDKPVNNEEEVSQMEENVLEEEPIKVNKTKVVDAVVGSVNPERKTVTFAEKHKEIPAIPYSQSQKGILIVNGTNRSNQTGEQGYKAPNPEDYTTVSKESKQDFTSIPQEQTEKDLQALPSAIANEGLQSSSPTAQQQNQAPVQFFMSPLLPPGVQMPSGPSHDPSGSDLPPDTPTLRYFFNLGYQCVMASQMNNQQLPFMYTYQGAMQDQMIQPTPQPVASLSQQQLFANMQHHQLAYQHAGLQNYQAPFHMPQTSQDATSQHDRASERNNPTSQHHQGQLQPQQQIQMSHQQQSGHFQPQQQQQQQSQFGPNWRTRIHYNSSNKSHMGHHGSMAQPHRPQYHQNSVGSSRQAHYKENKQNRKQGMKSRNNDSYTQPPYSNLSHPPNMAHNPATSSQATFYSIPGDQSKGHGPDYYPGSAVMFNPVNYHAHMQAGMPPHSTVSSRVMFN